MMLKTPKFADSASFNLRALRSIGSDLMAVFKAFELKVRMAELEEEVSDRYVSPERSD